MKACISYGKTWFGQVSQVLSVKWWETHNAGMGSKMSEVQLLSARVLASSFY